MALVSTTAWPASWAVPRNRVNSLLMMLIGQASGEEMPQRFGGIEGVGGQRANLFVDGVDVGRGGKFAEDHVFALAVALDDAQVGQRIERVEEQAGLVESGGILDALGRRQHGGHEDLVAMGGQLDLHVADLVHGQVDRRLGALEQLEGNLLIPSVAGAELLVD